MLWSWCFPFEIWCKVSLEVNTYQSVKVDVLFLKFDMKFLLKINAVHLMLSSWNLIKFLLKIITYQCCEVYVLVLKFDMKFSWESLLINAVNLRFPLNIWYEISIEINFKEQILLKLKCSWGQPIMLFSTHASIRRQVSHWNKINIRSWSTTMFYNFQLLKFVPTTLLIENANHV